MPAVPLQSELDSVFIVRRHHHIGLPMVLYLFENVIQAPEGNKTERTGSQRDVYRCRRHNGDTHILCFLITLQVFS